MIKKIIHHRAKHFSSLWNEGLWGKVLGLLWSIWPFFTFVRDETGLLGDAEKFKAVKMIPHISTELWAIGLLFILLVWLFEASYRSSRKFIDRIQILEEEKKPKIAIVFDSENTLRKFWSLESPIDENSNKLPGAFWQYRVEIQNISSVTLRNVRLTVESMGALPKRQESGIFDIDKSKMMAHLHPDGRRLVVVLAWSHPVIQAGMVIGENAYGPLKITVSADDTVPVIRTFRFDYQRTPMLFD